MRCSSVRREASQSEQITEIDTRVHLNYVQTLVHPQPQMGLEVKFSLKEGVAVAAATEKSLCLIENLERLDNCALLVSYRS